jgi:predicted ABC-type ATPase
VSQEDVHRFFQDSVLLERAELTSAAAAIHVRGTRLDFGQLQANSYFASVAADFIRRRLIGASASMTFETVMSSDDKITFMREAQAAGYRTYLYYISTSDPAINVSRVKNRVRSGGHTVPEDKIISRYYRSLDLLTAAIRASNRAYIFDNSTKNRIWLAEITDGSSLEMKTPEITGWFKRYILDRLDAVDE